MVKMIYFIIIKRHNETVMQRRIHRGEIEDMVEFKRA